MVKPSIEPGTELDGFTIGECVHRGGMATLWTVTHPGINVPLLMKVPRVAEGEDPAASFAMLDTTSREITFCRVPYDVEAAAERIRANGLPHWLADRLLVGK